MFALWVGLTVFFGAPRVAHAQWEAPPLKVIVLPFEGKGTGDLTAAEAVELELELAPNIRLVSSRGIRVALNKLAPDQNYLANDLASVMQEYEVDVLIRGERLNAETVGSQLRVSAIANDGYPRWQKAVPMPDDPVAKASDLGKRLVRVLRDWETLPPIEEHVVISMVEPEPNEPPSTPLRAPSDAATSKGNRDEPRGNERGWDEQPEAIPAKTRRRRSKRNIRRRSSLLNEEPISDANNRKSPAEGAGLQVSFGMGTGVWQYQLSGPTEAFVAQVGADAYPVLELQARGWFSEAFGVDVDLTGGKLDFELNSGPSLSVAPERFSSYHLDGSAAFLVRVWRGKGKFPAFFALRLGYQYSGASTELQTVNGQNTTLVPGWVFHAPSTGLNFRVGRGGPGFSWTGTASILPWGVYSEAPDNPGAQVVPMGWEAQSGIRYQTAKPVYFELGFSTLGISARFEGTGDRRGRDGGPWQDGRSLAGSLRPTFRIGSEF